MLNSTVNSAEIVKMNFKKIRYRVPKSDSRDQFFYKAELSIKGLPRPYKLISLTTIKFLD